MGNKNSFISPARNDDMDDDVLGCVSEAVCERVEVNLWKPKHLKSYLEESNDLSNAKKEHEKFCSALQTRFENGTKFGDIMISDEIFDVFSTELERSIHQILLIHLQLMEKEKNKKISIGFLRMTKKLISRLVASKNLQFDVHEVADSAHFYSDPELIRTDWLDYYEEPDEFKIKLIITDIPMSPFKRKFIAPVVSKTSLNQEYGLFHTAIVVGPYYLSWTTSQFLFEHEPKSRNAFLAMDCFQKEFKTDKEFSKMKDDLSKLIVKWNSNFEYTSISDYKNNKGNCQTFVKDVLKMLGLKFEPTGCVKDYLEKIKNQGDYHIGLTLQPILVDEYDVEDFLKDNNYKYKVIKEGQFQSKGEGMNKIDVSFMTHKELDDFAFYLVSKNITVKDEYPDEYQLMKSFDRGFWLRHFQDEDSEVYAPAESNSETGQKFCLQPIFETGCPFMNPKDTGTFTSV